MQQGVGLSFIVSLHDILRLAICLTSGCTAGIGAAVLRPAA